MANSTAGWKPELRFESGTLRLGIPPAFVIQEISSHFPEFARDPIDGSWCLPAIRYRAFVEWMLHRKTEFQDLARGYQKRDFSFLDPRTPFEHQEQAVRAWWDRGGRGLVVLPTGTGKSFVAFLAIKKASRPTLIICPTIDLMHQWQWQLEKVFGEPVGLAGGGFLEWRDLTVATYDSAYLHVEKWGNRYGLLVFDEAHHLPGQSHQLAARGSIAPFRLGLTATPEREDGMEVIFEQLIGPLVYRREIQELSGEHLAEYRTNLVFVDLNAQERSEYDSESGILRDYLAESGYSLGSQGGWNRFLREAARMPRARRAFLALRQQRIILQQCRAKLEAVGDLLNKHRSDRVLLFTSDNATVYRLSREFLIPALTHHTKAQERKAILQGFQDGTLPVLATSRVLNEGVDVPSAGVAIVLSGSGTVREHVQRLGRILRRYEGKQAVLHELVARGTKEEFVSQRRRRHDAYQ